MRSKIISVIVCIVGFFAFGRENLREVCVRCGRIDRCHCHANEKYVPRFAWVPGGSFWTIESYVVSFRDGTHEIERVAVPHFARHGLSAVLYKWESFSSLIKLPHCDIDRFGLRFDKWQQVGSTSNVTYAAGETVTISSDTTFVATWRSVTEDCLSMASEENSRTNNKEWSHERD